MKVKKCKACSQDVLQARHATAGKFMEFEVMSDNDGPWFLIDCPIGVAIWRSTCEHTMLLDMAGIPRHREHEKYCPRNVKVQTSRPSLQREFGSR